MSSGNLLTAALMGRRSALLTSSLWVLPTREVYYGNIFGCLPLSCSPGRETGGELFQDSLLFLFRLLLSPFTTSWRRLPAVWFPLRWSLAAELLRFTLCPFPARVYLRRASSWNARTQSAGPMVRFWVLPRSSVAGAWISGLTQFFLRKFAWYVRGLPHLLLRHPHLTLLARLKVVSRGPVPLVSFKWLRLLAFSSAALVAPSSPGSGGRGVGACPLPVALAPLRVRAGNSLWQLLLAYAWSSPSRLLSSGLRTVVVCFVWTRSDDLALPAVFAGQRVHFRGEKLRVFGYAQVCPPPVLAIQALVSVW